MKTLITLTLLLFTLSTQAALKTVTVALDWYINPDQAPLLVAIDQGFFKKEGLRIRIITPISETEPLKLLESGKADIGVSNQLELLQAVEKGAPLVRIASLASHTMTCIVTLNPKIRSLKALENHTIGYSGGPLSPALIRAMLRYNNVDLNKVRLVNIRMNLLHAILTHRVAAVAGAVRSVEVVELQQLGKHPFIFKPEDNGIPPYEEMVFVANKNRLNPDIIRRFVSALTQGAQYLARYPQHSWSLAKRRFPRSLAMTTKVAQMNHAIWLASVPYFGTHPAQLNQKAYNQFMHFLVKQGILSKIIPLKDYTFSP